MENQCSSSLKG